MGEKIKEVEFECPLDFPKVQVTWTKEEEAMTERQVALEEKVKKLIETAFKAKAIPWLTWHGGRHGIGGGEFVICHPEGYDFEHDLERAQKAGVFLSIEELEPCVLTLRFPKVRITWDEEPTLHSWCRVGPLYRSKS